MFDEFRSTAKSRRAAGATVASVVVHALLVAAIALLLTRAVGPVEVAQPPLPVSTLVYLEAPGPGGGGGGSPEPAAAEPIEIPQTSPPAPIPVHTPALVVPPPPSPALTVPVMTPEATTFRAMGPNAIALAAPTGGGGAGRGLGPGRGDGVGDGAGGNVGGGLARGGAGLEPPQLVRDREPAYTSEALRARVQGQVELLAVVLEDGSIGDVKVVTSLDRVYGLDVEAVKAARQWLFLPARQNGRPVRVAVRMFLDFRIN